MDQMTRVCLNAFAVLIAIAAVVARAGEVDTSKLPPAATRQVDFAKDVQPILVANCQKCHGPDKQKGGFRVDVKETFLTGGDAHAPNIHPGKSAESPLIHFVAGLDEDMLMPAKGERLRAEQIGLLRAWIDQGAVWPDDAKGTVAMETHWSLKSVTRPAVPKVEGVSNAVDAFIFERLKR